MTTRVAIVATAALIGALNLPAGMAVGALLTWQAPGRAVTTILIGLAVWVAASLVLAAAWAVLRGMEKRAGPP